MVESANLRWFEEHPSTTSRPRLNYAPHGHPDRGGEPLHPLRVPRRPRAPRGGRAQPDVALVGGITEARRVAALAETAQVESRRTCGARRCRTWRACTSPSPAWPPASSRSPWAPTPLRELPEAPIVEDGQVKAPEVRASDSARARSWSTSGRSRCDRSARLLGRSTPTRTQSSPRARRPTKRRRRRRAFHDLEDVRAIVTAAAGA